ncbi:hypothetical protein X801_06994 [Opisthorchis viverrini]|uniref:Uncharacterized protein n=1 Tax=Opisthorchis viverrini TaxID=6198 RepID=A0A1S8WSD1_OPIVI|nr:hypothetical protein X801_06994 [Opisthorchis viverrini]
MTNVIASKAVIQELPRVEDDFVCIGGPGALVDVRSFGPSVPPTSGAPASVNVSSWIEGISGHHLLSCEGFPKNALHRLFNLAHSFRQAVLKNKPLDDICRGKRVYEYKVSSQDVLASPPTNRFKNFHWPFNRVMLSKSEHI